MSLNTIEQLITKLKDYSPRIQSLVIDFQKATQQEEDIKENIKQIQTAYCANTKQSTYIEPLCKLSQLHEEIYNICDKKIKLFQEIYKELELLSRQPIPIEIPKATETYCVCGGKEEGDMIQCDKCQIWYHLLCMNVKTIPGEHEPWFCLKCAKATNITTQ